MDGDYLQFLNQDIISNILMQLPVKILMRCKLVCKYWKHVIEVASDKADHSSVIYNPSLIFYACKIGPVKLYLLDCDMQVRVLENHPLMDDSSSIVTIICSCNGLLCVNITTAYVRSPSSILFWNPFIKEAGQVLVDDYAGISHFGFGYLRIVKDHRLVRICAEFSTIVRRAEVYSLNMGSWREIDRKNLEGVAIFGKTITVDRTIFWIASNLDRSKLKHFDWMHFTVIVSFDMAKEEFALISSPMSHPLSIANTYLNVHDNKLAIISEIIGIIKLWVMEGESREELTWSLKYSVDPSSSGLYRPCVIWKNKLVSKNTIHQETQDCRQIYALSLIDVNSFVLERVILHNRVDDYTHIFNHNESVAPVCNI